MTFSINFERKFFLRFRNFSIIHEIFSIFIFKENVHNNGPHCKASMACALITCNLYLKFHDY